MRLAQIQMHVTADKTANLRHAEELLLETAATIDEIAQQVGYTNSDSFRRAFRRVRGVSPSVFRASMEKAAL